MSNPTKDSIWDDPRYARFKPEPWPFLKRALKVALDCIEWGDHEYLRAEFGRWPLKFWITIYEPSYRRSWHRRVFPWRLRCAIEGPIRQRVWSRCTICGSGFTFRELLARPSGLTFFQSGSVCHKECGRA